MVARDPGRPPAKCARDTGVAAARATCHLEDVSAPLRARIALALIFVLTIAAFSARTFSLSASRLQPRWDEVGYIALSRDYARAGGVAATIGCHLEGRCLESNRHPLFQLLLVPAMDDSAASFARGKLITFFTGLLLIAVVTALAWRAFGRDVAIGTAILLSLSPLLADTTAEIRHDMLFTAFACAAIYLIAEPFSSLRWLGIGALAGFAYLTKGSGHLLLAVAAGMSLRRLRFDVVRRPYFYLAIAGFALAASFLLWRNTVAYGNPFFNVNNRVAWIDTWADIWELQRSPEWNTIGLGWFVERHGWIGLVVRLVKGFFITFGVFIYSWSIGFAGVSVPAEQVAANIHLLALPVVSGILTFLLAAYGMVMRWRSGRPEDRTLVETVLLATLIFWAALSVGAVGGHDAPRYQMLLTFSWLPFAAHALTAKISKQRLAVAGVIALALQIFAFRDGLAGAPSRHFAVPQNWGTTSKWLRGHLQPGDKFASGYHSLYSTWDEPRPDTDPRWIYDFSDAPAKMAGHMAKDNVKTILLDAADPDYPYGRTGERDEEGLLSFDGWPRCFSDGGKPARFTAYCRP